MRILNQKPYLRLGGYGNADCNKGRVIHYTSQNAKLVGTDKMETPVVWGAWVI